MGVTGVIGEDGVRLGMIGCGQISERFFRQAAARDDCRFVAACARTLASAERKAAEHGVPAAFDDVERMLDSARPDAVVVATPHSVHAAPTLAAIERGIHVLVEKPMATSLPDCRAMVEAAAARDVRLMCLPFDHNPAFLTALGFLNQATLGTLTGAEAVLLIPGPPRDNWYYRHETAQGGAMLDCLVYPVSRLISLLGPASRVTGYVNTLIPHRIVGEGKRVESDVDDNVTLVIEWATGQQAVARTLWGTSFTRNDTAIYGREGTLWITGGRVLLHRRDQTAPPVEGAVPLDWQGIPNCFQIPIPLTTPNESLIDHFISAIRTGDEPRCGGRLQLHVHEILFRGYEAARTGRSQTLETSFQPWHTLEPGILDTRSRFL